LWYCLGVVVVTTIPRNSKLMIDRNTFISSRIFVKSLLRSLFLVIYLYIYIRTQYPCRKFQWPVHINLKN